MPTPSIAVLPFEDRSAAADQRHIGDGLAEELIRALSRVEGLRVVPRTSAFRHRHPSDVGSIADELGVTAVLTGRIEKVDDRLTVDIRLQATEPDAELWSESFDRQLNDVFELQQEIVERVVAAFELRLEEQASGALLAPPTPDVRAYEYYLKGREKFFEYKRAGVEAALQLFNMALTLDPDYARAHAGVAECCTFLFLYADGSPTDLEQADLASQRALDIAPELAEAHVARGLVLSLQHRFELSEQAFETALRLNPKLFEAYYFYGRSCFVQGDLESAAKLFGHASRIDPNDYQAPLLLAQIHDDLGRPDEAEADRRRGVEAVERRLELHPEETRALYMGANALVCLGERERGLRWAEQAIALDPDEPMLLYNVGCVYSLAGDSERAIDHLERSVRSGLAYIDWLQHDSNLDALREIPRFQQLLDASDKESGNDPNRG